ncbi:hypothetical protein [Cupriavidus necator]
MLDPSSLGASAALPSRRTRIFQVSSASMTSESSGPITVSCSGAGFVTIDDAQGLIGFQLDDLHTERHGDSPKGTTEGTVPFAATPAQFGTYIRAQHE